MGKRGKYVINKQNCKDYAMQKISERYTEGQEGRPTRVSDEFYGWLEVEVQRLIDARVNNRTSEGKTL